MPLDGSEFRLNPGQQRVWFDLYQSAARFALVYGGSRSGKTFLTIYTIIIRALKAPFSKHLVVRQEASAARAALARGNMATIRVVLRMCFPGVEPVFNEKYGYYEFENGAEIWVGGLNDEKAMERILGNEYCSIYINEASEVRHQAFILLRSRLAQVVKDVNDNPVIQRFYVDLNPTNRMHWTYRIWVEGVDPEDEKPIDRSAYRYAVINPYDNKENLTADYIADLENLPERSKARFLLGEYTADDENALWRRSYFKRIYENEDGSLPLDLVRVVVAIDPAISKTAHSDETGIVCMGVDRSGQGVVLEDASGKYRPEEWARRAISVFRTWGADRVVAEINQGGDMVEATLRAVDPSIPYTGVRANRGKERRAEPVAALYEKGRVSHVGQFSELEDQMCAITVGFDDKSQGWSPDRVDALVWAATELFPSLTARANLNHNIPIAEFSMV